MEAAATATTENPVTAPIATLWWDTGEEWAELKELTDYSGRALELFFFFFFVNERDFRIAARTLTELLFMATTTSAGRGTYESFLKEVVKDFDQKVLAVQEVAEDNCNS